MHIILIGNYRKDKQESMERFTRMLYNGFLNAGITSAIWRPSSILGRLFRSTTSGSGKWFGYIDKWLLFPVILLFRSRINQLISPNVRFHICDHSNAPYLNYLPKNKTGITCHDVLAIRGALGYADSYCPASLFGKILQKYIFHYLKRAPRLAAVSQFTYDQLDELLIGQQNKRQGWKIIYNSFNADFTQLGNKESYAILDEHGVQMNESFVLHVGSGLPRKNRKLLIDMVLLLGNKWTGKICYAGEPADKKLMTYAKSVGIENRVISIKQPDHITLLALYSVCEAFIFPSFSEGFGWPVIEAQACRTPVIASNLQPMPEISGGAVVLADPTKPDEFAKAFLSLQDQDFRDHMTAEGLKNSERFKLKDMIHEYIDLYNINSTKTTILCSSN